MWLDYQKPLDSVPHKWLIKALKLTKVPEKIITAIKTSIKKWSAIVSEGTPTNTTPTRNLPRWQLLCIAFYLLCKSVVIFVKQATGLSHWQKWE